MLSEDVRNGKSVVPYIEKYLGNLGNLSKMQNVAVETTQNVLINYRLASVGDRLLATLVDLMIFFAYFMVIVVLEEIFEFSIPEFAFILFYLPIFFYHLLCEVFLNGQSIGKRQMQIKVVKLDGSRPSLGAYILRWVIRPVDNFMIGAIGVLTILLTGKGQRLGDLAAGTTVIRTKRQTTLKSQEIFKQSDPNYKMTFPQVSQLSDHDISLIKEALAVFRDTANLQPIITIEQKVKSHLNINDDKHTSVKFLHTIIKDYTHYNTQGY